METIQTETTFRGRVFNIRIDKVLLPNGKTVQIDVVEHSGAVTILPVDEDGYAWFIRQYRHPIGQMLLELPAGVMDAGEDPLESAQRELREEIGMAAVNLNFLGDFYLAPGYSTEHMYVFLATGLHPAPLKPDEDESIEIERIPVGQIMQFVKDGKIKDSKSLATLLLWHPDNWT